MRMARASLVLITDECQSGAGAVTGGVCVALLEDLQARGLDSSRPVLLVLDGAKALHAAAKRVWGQNGLIQRAGLTLDLIDFRVRS